MTLTDNIDWGRSSPDDRNAWSRQRWAAVADDPDLERARAEATRLGQLAAAYAAGWRNGCRDRLSARQFSQAQDLEFAFAEEYAHHAWRHEIGLSGHREGYANAWESVLEAHQLAPEPPVPAEDALWDALRSVADQLPSPDGVPAHLLPHLTDLMAAAGFPGVAAALRAEEAR